MKPSPFQIYLILAVLGTSEMVLVSKLWRWTPERPSSSVTEFACLCRQCRLDRRTERALNKTDGHHVTN